MAQLCEALQATELSEVTRGETHLRILPRGFYSRPALQVAQDLLGKYLVRHIDSDELIGRIVEVEAYGGTDDPASHAYKGRTPRNRVMFGKPGVAYVYFTYGNHYCLNIVSDAEGVPAAVLMRALEPIAGIEIMKTNRGVGRILDLTNGPGKLTKALKIGADLNGYDVVNGKDLFVASAHERKNFEIVSTPRVGIKVGTDKLWRFHIKGNQYVSRK